MKYFFYQLCLFMIFDSSLSNFRRRGRNFNWYLGSYGGHIDFGDEDRCNPNQHTCFNLSNSLICLDAIFLCDGRSDCRDDSDETDCWCKEGECINCEAHISNNKKRIRTTRPRCNYFLRMFGYTYTSSGIMPNTSDLEKSCPICDGIINCYEERDEYHDEMECNITCPDNLPIPCRCQPDSCKNNGSVCYNETMKCDRISHCVDYSDEAGCSCESDQFRCKCFNENLDDCSYTTPLTNPCIPLNKTQDCSIECRADESDEDLYEMDTPDSCRVTISINNGHGNGDCYYTSAYHCRMREMVQVCGTGCPLGSLYTKGFFCDDGRIRSSYSFCDDEEDCFDGSDEKGGEIGFLCKGRLGKTCVLPQSNLYDNGVQCSDGLDKCYTTSPKGCLYECIAGDMFVAKSQMCDRTVNCPDLSDECLCFDSLGDEPCRNRFNQNRSSFCADLDLTSSITYVNKSFINEEDLTSRTVLVDSLMYVLMIFILAGNSYLLISLLAFIEVKLNHKDAYQFAIIFNVCICDVLKAVALALYKINSERYKNSDELSTSCSLIGSLLVTTSEASCLSMLWLATFRYFYKEEMKRKVTPGSWTSIAAGIWILSFIIGFFPNLPSGSDFFSQSIWFPNRYFPTLMSSEKEIKAFACRLAIIQNQSIGNWSSAVQVLKEFFRNYLSTTIPSLGTYSYVGDINTCLLNFYFPFVPDVKIFTLLVVTINQIIYGFALVFSVISYKRCTVLIKMKRDELLSAYEKRKSSKDEAASNEKTSPNNNAPEETDENHVSKPKESNSVGESIVGCHQSNETSGKDLPPKEKCPALQSESKSMQKDSSFNFLKNDLNKKENKLNKYSRNKELTKQSNKPEHSDENSGTEEKKKAADIAGTKSKNNSNDLQICIVDDHDHVSVANVSSYKDQKLKYYFEVHRNVDPPSDDNCSTKNLDNNKKSTVCQNDRDSDCKGPCLGSSHSVNENADNICASGSDSLQSTSRGEHPIADGKKPELDDSNTKFILVKKNKKVEMVDSHVTKYLLSQVNKDKTKEELPPTPEIVDISDRIIDVYVAVNVLISTAFTILYIAASTQLISPSFIFIYLEVFFYFINSFTDPFFIFIFTSKIFFWWCIDRHPVSEEEGEFRTKLVMEVLFIPDK